LPLLNETADKYRTLKNSGDKAFAVPPSSASKRGIAKRNPKEIAALFEKFSRRELYANLLIVCVSRLESMLNDVLRIFLAEYPQKLSVGLKGGDSNKTLPISVIVDAKTINDARKAVAESRLQGVFYSEPKEYLSYFESISGIKIPEDLFLSFVEIKATRDIIIHNDGKVNELYIRKSSNNGRAKLREVIPLDEEYFASCITAMKSISKEIEKQVRAKYEKAT
jgi:hypothetical protein